MYSLLHKMLEVHDRKRVVVASTIICSLVFFASSLAIWKLQNTFFSDFDENETEGADFIESNSILGAAGVLSLMVTLLYWTMKHVEWLEVKSVLLSEEDEINSFDLASQHREFSSSCYIDLSETI